MPLIPTPSKITLFKDFIQEIKVTEKSKKSHFPRFPQSSFRFLYKVILDDYNIANMIVQIHFLHVIHVYSVCDLP